MADLSPAVSLGSRLADSIIDLKKIVGEFNLEPGMRVADFGAGSGYFSIEMAKAVGDSGVVSAIDILDTSLETIRAKAYTEGLGNIQLVRANLEVVGSTFLADESQDLVLLASVLFQNDDKLGIIREAKRVLRPAGKLVVIDWQKGVGGFGPPDDYRISKETAISLVNQEGLVYEKDFFIDAYHFGMMFRK